LISNIQQMVITEMYRLSWIGDYFDPQTFLQLMETANPSNLTGYSNPEFDRLMALAATELDSERRMAIFRDGRPDAGRPARNTFVLLCQQTPCSPVGERVDQ